METFELGGLEQKDVTNIKDLEEEALPSKGFWCLLHNSVENSLIHLSYNRVLFL